MDRNTSRKLIQYIYLPGDIVFTAWKNKHFKESSIKIVENEKKIVVCIG